MPQLEKFWVDGVVPLGGVAELGGWNLLSIPLITTLVVDGFLPVGWDAGVFDSGFERFCVSLSPSVGVEEPVSVSPLLVTAGHGSADRL